MINKVVSSCNACYATEISQEGSSASLWVKHFPVKSCEHTNQWQDWTDQQIQRVEFTVFLTKDKELGGPKVLLFSWVAIHPEIGPVLRKGWSYHWTDVSSWSPEMTAVFKLQCSFWWNALYAWNTSDIPKCQPACHFHLAYAPPN